MSYTPMPADFTPYGSTTSPVVLTIHPGAGMTGTATLPLEVYKTELELQGGNMVPVTTLIPTTDYPIYFQSGYEPPSRIVVDASVGQPAVVTLLAEQALVGTFILIVVETSDHAFQGQYMVSIVSQMP